MVSTFTPAQLTGQDDSHLVPADGEFLLHPEVAAAFCQLQVQAKEAGFELSIASAHRSYERQLHIWNEKVRGARPVYDDAGNIVDIHALSAEQKLHAILRYSALPGTSRHHWGTDLDVYDASAVPQGYRVQLSLEEVAPGGPFDAMHRWLDECMAAGEAKGFFRPYSSDCGGIAPERWHLSYAPLAHQCQARLGETLVRSCWQGSAAPLLHLEIEAQFSELFARYVQLPSEGGEATR